MLFANFGQRIRLWATFNEPTCYTFCGWIAGIWAPGRLLKFKTAGRILGDMLQAHTEVYTRLKAMPGGNVAQIGAHWLIYMSLLLLLDAGSKSAKNWQDFTEMLLSSSESFYAQYFARMPDFIFLL